MAAPVTVTDTPVNGSDARSMRILRACMLTAAVLLVTLPDPVSAQGIVDVKSWSKAVADARKEPLRPEGKDAVKAASSNHSGGPGHQEDRRDPITNLSTKNAAENAIPHASGDSSGKTANADREKAPDG